jgi:hypothetical protein
MPAEHHPDIILWKMHKPIDLNPSEDQQGKGNIVADDDDSAGDFIYLWRAVVLVHRISSGFENIIILRGFP